MNKFNIGDRVASKRLGLPMIGTVGGILDPMLFDTLFKGADWKLYPEWRNSSVYWVLFDTAAKPMSYQEYRENLVQSLGTVADLLNPKLVDSSIKRSYDELAEIEVAMYPEDDLDNLDNLDDF